MAAFLKTGPYKTYPPFNRCIYCGATEQLTDEHIIPFALGGNVILPQASCLKCATVTRDFEETCTRPMMGPLRIRMNLQTRRKKQRPKHIALKMFGSDGRQETLQIPAMSYPALCFGIKLDQPRMTQRLPLSNRVTGQLFAKYNPSEISALIKPGQVADLGQLQLESFCRLIAKIGHAHVMAALANEGTSPPHDELFLPDIILGNSPHFQHYVGGDNHPLDDADDLHQLRFNRYIFDDRKILVSTVRLFACFGMPRYHVIACYEPRKDGAPTT